jgi:hypothetical protein
MINKPLNLLIASITALISTDQLTSPIISASEVPPKYQTIVSVNQSSSKKVSYSIGGVSVRTTEKEILTKWGKPLRRKQGQGNCGVELYADIEYPGAKLNLYGGGSQPLIVLSMTITNPKWRTEKGIKVGDSIERAKKYYRLNKSDGHLDKTYHYGVVNANKDRFPSFGFTVNKSGKIIEIGMGDVPYC